MECNSLDNFFNTTPFEPSLINVVLRTYTECQSSTSCHTYSCFRVCGSHIRIPPYPSFSLVSLTHDRPTAP
ncbi:hypothetical protein PNOK_0002100 [Pyrrhoderma noxium]|uniref:Uncharacterized protein n=1 Tax=Pyrrhoderma noxium TaxID=2282107 RepID=A0A286UTT1_9AGAM|nr:hypothetical protein PNOK_0002100 [Pyrrhoderma noxium]